MAMISYHASHEQFSPSELIDFVKLAEQAGFTGCHSSDHFHPWSKRQGHSGYAFSWMGAVMEATRFPCSIITAPGQRYHPAIVAQAIATLAEMYPDRLEVALGSGEALNEHITGARWPEKHIRNQRLLESANAIRRLLKGYEVNHIGTVVVHKAKLYTLPKTPPLIMCAAISAETSYWAGSWADGLLTIYKSEDALIKNIQAFYSGGGKNKPIHVQVAFSYARDASIAQEEAYDQWRSNCLDADDLSNIATVEEFDAAAEKVSKEMVLHSIPVSTDLNMFRTLIQNIIRSGASNVILHNVNKHQRDFIEDFGKHVLPGLTH
jgi:coenzyme F420-dependent glucose-6-phosphate dehydrogenase